MKITGVSTQAFRYASAPGDAGSAHTFVALRTDESSTGIAVARGDLCVQVVKLVEPFLTGEDPRGVVGLWERMRAAVEAAGGDSVSNAAVAALDMALWDLKARIHEEPLWKTLGGSPPKAKAHVRLQNATLSTEDVARQCATLVERYGIHSVELGVTGERDGDMQRLESAYRALKTDADEPVLAVSGPGQYLASDAIDALRHYEKRLDVTWVNQPAAATDAPALAQISAGVRAAVCAGRNLKSTAAFRPLFEAHALDLVEINLAAVGITGALQLADCAFGYELPVILSSVPGDIQVHLGSVLPYLMSVEMACDGAAPGVLESEASVIDGWATAGERPGTGLKVDRAALQSLARSAG